MSREYLYVGRVSEPLAEMLLRLEIDFIKGEPIRDLIAKLDNAFPRRMSATEGRTITRVSETPVAPSATNVVQLFPTEE